jgi:uncharacterized membrane protein YraQ (UPF0718 family)
MQSKRDSFKEVIVDMCIGIFLAYCITQTIGVHILGIGISHAQNIALTILLTGVSITRKYLIRRYFNKRALHKFERSLHLGGIFKHERKTSEKN